MFDLIEDGYTEKGYIAAEDGIHGALEFEYRPMTPSVQAKLLEKKEADSFVDAVAKVLVKDGHLKSWTLLGQGGITASITEANVKRVKPRLFDKLWTVIAGLRPNDNGNKTDLEGDSKN